MTLQRGEGAEALLRERIATGELKPGARIGQNVGAIARDYGVGKTTMQGILAALDEEGLIRREHGVGSFVADNAAAVIAEQRDDGPEAVVRKLQEDVAGLKADVAELQTRGGFSKAQKRGAQQ